MDQELAIIYGYAQIIPAMKEIIKYCYSEMDFHIPKMWDEIKELVVDFCKKVSEKDSVLAQKIYDAVADACSHTTTDYSSYILMGDVLQQTIPLFYQGMKLLGNIDVADEKYHFFSSSSGFLIIQNNKNQRVYHSTLDPMWEAYELSKRIYKPRFTTMKILGCGLGYLPWQIYCDSNCSIDIHIYHNDEKLINYALEFGVLGWIPENKLHIHIEESGKELVKQFLEGSGSWSNYGYHYCLDVFDELEDAEKSTVANFGASNGTASIWGNLLIVNGHRNALNVKEFIGSFEPETKSDEWIVIAAGPSLDQRLDYIKENVGKKTILCASTVLKKLLKNNIIPDAVCVLDPQERTWGHFEGLENHSVPLLLNNTGNWRFGENYTGKKYIVPSLTEETIVKDYMLKNIQSWYLGSTVSSMMMEIAVKKGAKSIEMIGIDLAYPTNKTHASGTMDEKEINKTGMILIPSVTGGEVYTTRQFLFYIKEIEAIISKYREIDFYNLSTCGARLEGSMLKE